MAVGWRGLCPVCATDVSETPTRRVARKHGGRIDGVYRDPCPGTGKQLAVRYGPDEEGTAPTPRPEPAAPVEGRVEALDGRIAALEDGVRTARAEVDRIRAEVWRVAHVARTLLDANRHLLDAMTSSAEGARHAATSSLHLIESHRKVIDLAGQSIPDYPNT